jgi:hypothetical protein
MIESYLQVTCDGCGYVESADEPGQKAKVFRGTMKILGWRNHGRFDYCPQCVKNGKAARRYSMFATEDVA